MTKPIAEQVAELSAGDWVEARFEYDDGESAVITGLLQARGKNALFVGNYDIRYDGKSVQDCLTSITRVPRPIPSEPEVGSFALLDDEEVARLFERSGNWRDSWSLFGDTKRFVWEEIYPHITRLYTPSGDLVTGFEYAGDSK